MASQFTALNGVLTPHTCTDRALATSGKVEFGNIVCALGGATLQASGGWFGLNLCDMLKATQGMKIVNKA